jgi:hypothetical protein
VVYQSIKTGARVAQWVRSLDLTTRTSLSPIFTSNMCIHIIRSNRVKLWLNDVFVSTFAAFNRRHTAFNKRHTTFNKRHTAFNKRHTAFNKRHTTFAKLWLEKNALYKIVLNFTKLKYLHDRTEIVLKGP